MLKRSFKAAAVLAMLGTLAACTHRITDFTFLSTKNVDLSQAAAFERGDARVTGEDQAFIIIFVPTGIPNIKEATDRAIESIPGAVGLVDGVIYRTTFYIPMLFGVDKFVVEGTPLINKKALRAAGVTSRYMISEFDETSRTYVTRSVSEATYFALREKILGGNVMKKVEKVGLSG